ncbi:hypothetical protein ACFQ1L_11635 [Phytohabitans flavus]|uniref:hypothetical protein n=1 Tax=Phytohabitans flavus TaxID=1076124 RepID=UPI00362DBF93
MIPLSYGNPAAQAAALQAAQRIGGVQVLERVTDAAGRTGVAVARAEGGTRIELIFDPQTYRYLGYNLVDATGEIQHSMAIKRTAFVDKIKQLP